MKSLDFTKWQCTTFSLILIIVSLAAIMNVTNDRVVGEKIYDLGHDMLPTAPYFTNDVQAGITLMVLLYKIPTWSNTKIHSYLTFIALMLFFRMLTTYATTLPVARDICPCKPGFLTKCNDYIFSGHTTFNVVTSFFIGAPLWPIWPLVASVGTVASRSHYTVDVLLAWLIFLSLKSNMPSAI